MMPTAQIGPWEFELPDGWTLTANESSDAYFQAPDGTKGLYVKAIELSEPKPTSRDLSDYIQDVHLRNFSSLDASWILADRWWGKSKGLTRSGLDLYDAQAEYRVLSLVLCSAHEAIQVSIHDYSCEHYAAVRPAFNQLANSIERAKGAV